jgi:hypothetical protein
MASIEIRNRSAAKECQPMQIAKRICDFVIFMQRMDGVVVRDPTIPNPRSVQDYLAPESPDNACSIERDTISAERSSRCTPSAQRSSLLKNAISNQRRGAGNLA